MIRVVIADDHHLVRQGIRSLLEGAGDIEVIGEAGDGQEAVMLVQKLSPDVLVLDIGMPRLNGVQAAEDIRSRRLPTRIVMLSMHTDRRLVQQSLRAGASGYVLKDSVLEELLLAIRAASRGYTYLSPQISQAIVDFFLAGEGHAGEATPFEQLSPREREILKLIAEGRTNNEMADILKISVRTVQKHRANLMAKLDVHDVAGLTRIAIMYGLIFIDE
jgi:DNA-binding NarL/FixJ family response regulator